jgi:hypothetical protein
MGFICRGEGEVTQNGGEEVDKIKSEGSSAPDVVPSYDPEAGPSYLLHVEHLQLIYSVTLPD